MFFKKNREAAILRVLAGALGIFLAAGAGTLAKGRSPALLPAWMSGAADPGVDSGCQAALDAGNKLYTTPYHMYGAETVNGKPVNTEGIFAGGALYVLVNGKWSLSPVSPEEMLKMMKAKDQGKEKNGKNGVCHYVRDESVSGESAALYSTHEEDAKGKTDVQSWVSKGKGLLLRQETDVDMGGTKVHISSRFEYSNIHAPKL
ncbi:MAG TPA: hypothetical protein VKV95_03630 [Terriglobia bacterium]|nr:hypothetical protein [Terriglobia bacterium]